jgi:hypothetical protein
LNHRVIAMVGAKPVRVECSTCGSHHNYRANAPGAAPAARPASTPRDTAPRGARGPTRAQQAEMAREQAWQRAIAGRGMSDFRVYRVSNVFQEGDLVRHSKFGDGVVTRVIDARKIEILFKDEARMLAQGLVD